MVHCAAAEKEGKMRRRMNVSGFKACRRRVYPQFKVHINVKTHSTKIPVKTEQQT